MNKQINMPQTLRYFYTLTWRYSPSYILLMLCSIVVNAMAPFANILFPKMIIDELTGGRNLQVLMILAGAVVGANCLVALLNAGIENLMSRRANRLGRYFNTLIGLKTMDMDYEHIENPDVLNQSEKAKTGMSWYSGGIQGISSNIVTIISSGMTLAGVTYIVSRLNLLLVGVLLLTVALDLIGQAYLKKLQIRFWQSLVGYNRIFSYYVSVLKNFKFGKDIRLYNTSGLILDRVKDYISDTEQIQGTLAGISGRFGWISAFLAAVQQVVLYGYLALRVLTGSLGLGDVTMYIGAVGSFTQSIRNILVQVLDIQKNTKFMAEYVAFMQLPAIKPRGRHPIPLQEEHAIEFCNVSFRYPGSDQLILKNVCLTIPAGQKLSIVGMNGAGKTTFIKLLIRLYDPTEGSILLDGVDIRELDYNEYLQLFSVVFQDFALLAFNVKDNVVCGAELDDQRLNTVVEQAGLSERISSLEHGLGTSIYKSFDEQGFEPSGGEAQKLAIARALYRDHPVVVLDEPTAALDPVAEYEIYNHFDKLVGGKTAIYISHRLSSCRFCDTIAVFHEGGIIQYGHHNRLVLDKLGKYSEMFDAQAQYYIDCESA